MPDDNTKTDGVKIPGWAIPSANTIASFSAAILSLLVALHVMQQPTADKINKEINDNKQTIQTVVDTVNQIKNKPADSTVIVTPPVVNPPPTPVPADNSDQIKALQDQIKNLSDIINRMNKQPEPTPVGPVNPPVPENLPQPSTLKVIITDENEKVVTTNTVNVGEQFLITCSNANVRWQVSKHGKVKKTELPNHIGYTFELADENAWIEFFVTASLDHQVSVMVTANKAPQPPPNPVVNPPAPTPTPTPPVTPDVSKAANVYLIYDPKTVTPEVTGVLNSTSWWQTLAAKGSKWSFYTTGTNNPKGAAVISYAASKGVQPPFMVIEDPKTNQFTGAFPAPKSTAEVTAAINSSVR